MRWLLDNSEMNSDWPRAKWTWPKYKSKAFYDKLEKEGLTIKRFQGLQMYIQAVRNGLIIDDEWTGIQQDWSSQWMVNDFVLSDQVVFRSEHIFGEINWSLSNAQAEANRALTVEETGQYLIDYLNTNTTGGVGSDKVKVSIAADISGIQGLEKANQIDAWASILLLYSERMVRRITSAPLPQIWIKRGARAVYYPKRNLIVTPGVSGANYPLMVHAASHYVETLGLNMFVIEQVRNAFAIPGTLHMVRRGLYSLRGPWLDQQDGVLRGYDTEQLEQWYMDRKAFTSSEIESRFVGKPTEYFAMMAQRVANGDEIEIANLWSKHPAQLLLYVAIIRGNFMEAPDAI